jgi:cobalt-precorrin-6B (C15)-methyltransferase
VKVRSQNAPAVLNRSEGEFMKIEKCSGGPTKPEIIAVSLLKLQLQPSDVMADVGCGSGAVSLEAAKKVKQVYAIDHRKAAINTTKHNLEECNIDNVTLIEAEASAALENLSIDCAFIGGTKNIENTINAVLKAGATRLVVNAVRIETVSETITLMKELGVFREALHVSISKNYELAGETMFKPYNPVYIIVGGTQC